MATSTGHQSEKIKEILSFHGLRGIIQDACYEDLIKVIGASTPAHPHNDEENCSQCGRLLKTYKRPITRPMVESLLILFRATIDNPGTKYFHLHDDLKLDKRQSADFAKFVYWEFIEQDIKNDEEKEVKRTSGRWRITKKGIRFLHGEVVPSHVLIRLGKIVGFASTTTKIKQAALKYFNFSDLMQETSTEVI